MTRQRRRTGPAALAAVAAEWAQLRQWATSVIRHASVTLMELGTSTRVSLLWMSAKNSWGIIRVPNDHEHAQANKFKIVVEFKNMIA